MGSGGRSPPLHCRGVAEWPLLVGDLALSTLAPLSPHFGEENLFLHTHIEKEVLQLAQGSKALSESKVVSSRKGLGSPRESFRLQHVWGSPGGSDLLGGSQAWREAEEV